MAESVMYHEGNRQLQDQFDSRRISDRLEEKLMRKEFSADDKQFIEACHISSWRRPTRRPARLLIQGRCAGLCAHHRAFRDRIPDYDGNGMFKSLGNIVANADVGCCSSPCTTSHGACSQRQRQRERRRPAAGGDRRRAIDRSRDRARDLSELSALYSDDEFDRTVDLRAARWTGCAGAGMEGFADFKDCIHPRQPTFKG
jgi:hypothetical protein